MPAGAADYAAQHVPPAFVRGDDAVAYHEHCTFYVVGDDADRDIAVFIGAVCFARDLADLVEDLSDAVDLEHVVDALDHAGQPLKPHAGVNVLLPEFGIVALPVVVELREYVVPDFHVTVAVAAGLAVGAAAAVFFTAVKVNLGAGAAGTLTVLPEVVVLAEPDNALGRNPDDIPPDGKSLVVFFVYRRPEQLGRNLKVFCEELPRPDNGFFFEVVAEAEVAEHLKEGAVARGVPHTLKVGGADALLAGDDPPARRHFFAGKVFLHGRHARIYQEKRFVVMRYERK